VVAAFHHRQRHLLAGGFCRGSEIAALALEFRGFQRAVDQVHRRHQLIEVALRAELVLGLIGELHVLRTLGQPRRLEIEHAAAAHPTLDQARRQAEVLLPIGGQ